MTIRLLNNGDLTALEDFLFPYRESSMFICSNLRVSGVEYQDKSYHGDYFGAFDDASRLIGVIAHYWNGNIMTQCPDRRVLQQLVLSLKEQMNRPCAGVLGPYDQAEVVIQTLGLANAQYTTSRKEGLYELALATLKEPILLPDYAVVKATTVSKDVLTNWLKAYEIEALEAEDNLDLAVRIKNRIEVLMTADCWVLLKNNQPVSLSAFNAKLEDIIQVGPVWTPPEHRNRGYARLLVGWTLQIAKTQGVKKAILFTDNPAAVKAYESIGFKKIGHYRLALLAK